jgi:hypothetical protein
MSNIIYLKAYLAGALRDIYIGKYYDKNGKTHWVIRIYSKDITWLQILADILKQAYRINTSLIIPKKGTPYIEKYMAETIKTIAKEMNHPIGKSLNWNTPGFIKYSRDKEIWREYIAGFFDAEGGIDTVKKQLKIYQSWNGITCPPLEDIKEKLNTMFNIETGIVSRYPNRNYNPRFVLRIKRKDTIKFFKIFPLRNPSKIKKITLILRGDGGRKTAHPPSRGAPKIGRGLSRPPRPRGTAPMEP